MPTVITGVDTAALATGLTGPSDGESSDAADVNVPFQSLLNNTNKTAKLVIADFAALRALTTMVGGERFFVAGYGLYEWAASSVAPENVPWVIDPTVGGSGRFHSMVNALRDTGASQSLASTNSLGRLNTSQVGHNATVTRNAYIDNSAYGSTITTTTSITYVDTAATTSVVVLAADKILIQYSFFLDAGTPATQFSGARIRVTEDSGGTPVQFDLVSTEMRAPTTTLNENRVRYVGTSVHTVTTGGTALVLVRIITSAITSAATLVAPGALSVVVFRP